MAVKSDTLRPHLQAIARELEEFCRLQVCVGIQSGSDQYDAAGSRVEGADATLLTIARVHEYGMTIHPRHADNLAIPIDRKAEGKSPKDFPGMVFIKSEKGFVFGVQQAGTTTTAKAASTRQKVKPSAKKTTQSKRDYERPDDKMEYLFLLLPSVHVTERSFIRAGFDSGKEQLQGAFKHAVSLIASGQATAMEAAQLVGAVGVAVIQGYIKSGSLPPKSKITKETTVAANSPLINRGVLYNSITYQIVRK